jgi:integrase
VPTITKRGGRWLARVRRRGYPDQAKTFRTQGLAEKWARDIEAAIDAGRFVPTAREAERTTLGEALERYSREVTPRKRTNRPELGKIAKLREHPIALRMLASIRGADVAALRDELAGRGLAPTTVRLHLAIVSHVFTVAAREWGLEGLPNPVRNVAKPSTAGRARRRRAEGDELQRILAAARMLSWWAAPAIELAVETAMRRAELAALAWEHVDLRAGIAHLPMTKNGSARDVPLSPRACEILQALPRRISGSVFGVGADALSHAFADARALAGVKGLRLHDLRREATSRLFERGDLSIGEIQAVTGHKTLQQLATYTAPAAARIAAKLKKKPGTGPG